MVRVKNPTTQKAAQTTESIVSTTVGECMIFLHLNVVIIEILSRAHSNMLISHPICRCQDCFECEGKSFVEFC